jgi:hypothetical protein
MTLEEKSRALEVRGSCLAKARGRQKDYFRFFINSVPLVYVTPCNKNESVPYETKLLGHSVCVFHRFGCISTR